MAIRPDRIYPDDVRAGIEFAELKSRVRRIEAEGVTSTSIVEQTADLDVSALQAAISAAGTQIDSLEVLIAAAQAAITALNSEQDTQDTRLSGIEATLPTLATTASVNARSTASEITGDGVEVAFTIAHGMNTFDVAVIRCYDTTTGVSYAVQADTPNDDDLLLTFASAPASGQELRVLITRV